MVFWIGPPEANPVVSPLLEQENHRSVSISYEEVQVFKKNLLVNISVPLFISCRDSSCTVAIKVVSSESGLSSEARCVNGAFLCDLVSFYVIRIDLSAFLGVTINLHPWHYFLAFIIHVFHCITSCVGGVGYRSFTSVELNIHFFLKITERGLN